MTIFAGRTTASVAVLALLMSSFAASTATFAADMLEDEVQDETLVEFGTGWYLRGDVGYTSNQNKRLAEQSTLAANQGRVIETIDQDNVFSYGAAVGYNVTPKLRFDVGIERLADSEFSVERPTTNLRPPCSTGSARFLTSDGFGGTTVVIRPSPIDNCIENETSSYSLHALTANAFYDIGDGFGRFQPFIGGALGLVRNKYEVSYDNITCTAQEEERCGPTDGNTADFGEQYTQEGNSNSGTAYHFLGAVMAGVSYDITDNLKFDTTYRYARMTQGALWGGPNGVEDAGIPTGFHTVKFGLRLEIW